VRINFASAGRGLPVPELLFLCFFAYTAALSLVMNPISTGGIHPSILLILVAVYVFLTTAITTRWPATRWVFAYLRFGVVLTAYREMDWFTSPGKTRALENAWIVWDRGILAWLRPAIEAAGALFPSYLEICYAFVYGIGVFCVGTLIGIQYFAGVPAKLRDDRVDRWMTMYLAATLGTYALFPYFPSDPPRVIFPGMDSPGISTVFREFNLFLVGGYGIHSSVFPSAHVSSALAAGLGLLWVLPDRPRWGGGVIVYALSVAVATIYGRYHYAADAAGGIGMALLAALICRYWPSTASVISGPHSPGRQHGDSKSAHRPGRQPEDSNLPTEPRP